MFVGLFLHKITKPEGIVPFTINVKQEKRDSSGTSFVSFVELILYGNNYRLMKGLKITVNQKEFSTPYTDSYSVYIVALSNNKIKLTTNFGLSILYENDEDMTFSLSKNYRNYVCGICGNFDGLYFANHFFKYLN